MNALRSANVDNRFLGMANLTSAAVWHPILFVAFRSRENTPVLLQGLFYLLPLLSLVISLVLVVGLVNRSQHCPAWLWLPVVAGFSPFVTFVLYVLNS